MKHAGRRDGDRDKHGTHRPGPADRYASGRPGSYADGRAPGRYTAYRGPAPSTTSTTGDHHTDDQAGNDAVTKGPHDGSADGARGTAAPFGVPATRRPSEERDPSGDVRKPAAGGPGGHGPGSRGPGTGGSGGDGPEDPDHGPDGFGDDEAAEQALSRMLKEAVQDVQPRAGSLEHLRRAVPARRARKRQALVGLAATVVLLGTAVPAFVHVTQSGDSGGGRPTVAGHDAATQGGGSGGKNADGGRESTKRPEDSGGTGQDDPHEDDGGGQHSGGTTTPPDPGRSLAASSPACTVDTLGNARAVVGAPGPDGRVYGSFRVFNIADSDCTVENAGRVYATTQGAADPARVTVVDHTAGDPATGLPAPAAQAAQLILRPGEGYEIRFAWVPSQGCQQDGGSGGDVSPGPTPTDTTEDAQPVDGSISVVHAAEPGAPTTVARIQDACAGTVYRTGLLPASS